MTSFRKFRKLRIDLDTLYGYDVYISDTRQKGYHDTLNLYIKGANTPAIHIKYFCLDDDQLFESDIKMLDEYFGIKSDAEDKLLP